ncbi:hypothetical protein BC832DRAFT_427760 [Gaertneriomyces semiglobifer]|nr:hypothetical protein BC832DRAFT_427760 [Gaertneriomyces semiglobifer]
METMQRELTLTKLRLGCVPEHFSSPLYQAVAKGLFEEEGLEVEIVSCPGGTGEMVSMLKSEDLDVAIALTEGLVASLANNDDSNFRIVGTYVTSPLTWSIATSTTGPHAATPRESPGPEAWTGLKGAKIGISRYGSGSHIIPYVMADKMGWLDGSEEGKAPFDFVVLKNITGLVQGVTDGTIDAFLWERVMTKPHYDSGELHHLSNITPPWPAFSFAATTKTLANPASLKALHKVTSVAAKAFTQNHTDSIAYVQERFKLPEDDVKTWFSSVRYPQDTSVVSRKVVDECVSVLKKAGVIEGNGDLPIDRLVSEKAAKIAD